VHTERPSATARLIAQSTVFLSRDPDTARLLPEGAAAWCEALLAASAPLAAEAARTWSLPPGRWLVQLAERLALPGIQAHYAARKRFIEDAARAFLAQGGTQAVVIGAGLDTLAPRLAARFARANFVEIDHPATQRDKRLGLDGLAPVNLRLVPADLSREPLAHVLARVPGLQTRARTFFAIEGLTMYLSAEAVSDLLRACADGSAPGSRVAWTFMEPDPEGRVAFRGSRRGLVNRWLARRSEPFTWGVAREGVSALVAPLGWRVVEIADAPVLRTRYLEPLGLALRLAEGEAICLCEKP